MSFVAQCGIGHTPGDAHLLADLLASKSQCVIMLCRLDIKPVMLCVDLFATTVVAAADGRCHFFCGFQCSRKYSNSLQQSQELLQVERVCAVDKLERGEFSPQKACSIEI